MQALAHPLALSCSATLCSVPDQLVCTLHVLRWRMCRLVLRWLLRNVSRADRSCIAT